MAALVAAIHVLPYRGAKQDVDARTKSGHDDREVEIASMKKRTKLLVTLTAAAAALYGCYVVNFPSATLRYRLTLEAEVDGRPVVGSGVIQVTRQDATILKELGASSATTKGEAIALDMGEKGIVFALLHGREIGLAEDHSFPPYVIFFAFKDWLNPRADVIEKMRALKQQRPKAELPFELLPMLVRFRDISDPLSVEKVDPANLSATLGPGVTLRRATIEITDDPVTTGIEGKLPWLKGLEKRGGALDGSTTSKNNSLQNNLGGLSFRRWGI